MKYLVWLCAVSACMAAETIAILPANVALKGPEARHQLIAEGNVDGRQQDRTRTLKWTSSNASGATVDDSGLVTPVADGTAVISAGPARATA